MKRITLTIGTLFLVSGSAMAHDWRYTGTEDIHARLANQLARIAEARRCGDLTWREYWYLKRREGQIAAHERIAFRDGYISYYERQRLHAELNQLDREIYRLRHNESRAWWRDR